ncbi:MAG: SIR2 family NAD-dependent protein deacylase [Candidatus Baldrarchaeia archaeon]
MSGERELMEAVRSAAELIVSSEYVIALTGAGISVESGIPPFRGPGGIWTKYGEPPPDQYQEFLRDPKGWWERRLKRELEGPTGEMVRKIYEAKPNLAHKALAELEEMGILKSIITQNIDGLHQKAGSKNVIEIHGNIYKLRCISCNARFDRDKFEIKELPPLCPNCGGLVKPDVVYFGEPIPPDMLNASLLEVYKCDCMLVVGTSAVVYPAAGFPIAAKRRGAFLIEVNPYETSISHICDVVLREAAGKALPLVVQEVRRLLARR